MPRIQERINTNVPGTVLAKGLSKLFQLALPYTGWVGLLVAGFVIHAAWHTRTAAWGVLGLGVLVGLFTRHLTHQRGAVGQWLAPVTVWLGAVWLFLADLHGVPREAGLWFIVGLAMCITWNIWTGVHENASQDGGLGFLKGAEKAGVEGLKLSSIQAFAHKITAIVHKPAGQMVTEDLQSKLRYIESGMEIPRGSLNVNPHPDNASLTHLVVSDPRVLDKPIPYPGPSIPHGGSMADPLVGGKFQDGEPLAYQGTNTHVLANGTTGAGKTKSFGYNEIGETATRFDGGVLAIDISKRRQFFGAIEPALHRFETTPDRACELMQQVHRLVSMRADFLGERGFEKWEKGCGLLHWTVWLEEAVDIIRLLDQADLYDDFESDARNMRSAGMRLVISLQRPTFDQIPPTVRAMLDYLSFGLKTGSDEAYALSDRQKAADCAPGLWANKYPGKSYFDSYSLDAAHCTMENRWFSWGDNADLIRAHSLRYPASGRPADHMSAEVLGLPLLDVSHLGRPPITDPGRQPVPSQPAVAGQPASANGNPASGRPAITLTRPASNGQPQQNGGPSVPAATASQPPGWDMSIPDGWTPPQELPEDAPDGEFWDNKDSDLSDQDLIDAARETGADGEQVLPPPPPDTRFDFTPERGERWAPDLARAAFQELLGEMRARGQMEFQIRDVVHLADKVGNTPQWLYKVCEEFCRDGILHKKPGRSYPQKFVINRAS